MNIIDILVLLVLAFSLFAGMYKGFIASGLATAGLAGAWFGFSAIPARWVDALAPGLRQDLDILAAAAESHRSK